MKNKEEPSANSQRGNPSGQVDLYRSGGVGPETTGSWSRPGRDRCGAGRAASLELVSDVFDGGGCRSGQPGNGVEEREGEPRGSRPRWDHHRGIPRLVSTALADDSTTASRWHVPAWSGAQKSHRQTRWRSAVARHSKRSSTVLIQQAIVQVLTPIFDPHFSESSFGFRPKRSAHGAAKQVQRIHPVADTASSADIDLSKFFDRVQHDVLMARVARRVDDKLLLRLIGRYLRAGVMVEGVLQPTDVGTPQGGPLSPVLE